jgi:PAS domain S-box-containing protein
MKNECTILIVDDEPVGRETLEALLLKEGHALAFASNGREALAQAAQLQPDAVLLDIMMPGMDGYEVCRQLRATPALADIPVILVTALDDADSRIRGIEAGADDFVTKPYNRLELRARVRNITRLNRYRRLMEARGKFEQIFNLSPEGIVVADAHNHIQMANPAMLELCAAPAADHLLGQNLLHWISTDHAAACGDALQAVLHGAKTLRLEAAVARPNGDRVPVELTLGAITWDGQSQAQVIFRDIRDRAEKELLEAKLLRAQRLESIGTLASGIAHDLNNVLTPALMSVEMLAKRTEDPKSKTILGTLERSIMRGAGIVKQVLAFGRGLEGAHDLLQPRYLLREIEQIATETFPKSIETTANIQKDLWLVRGDSTQLHQTLLNLCLNARDAMPNGGALTLTAKNVVLDAMFAQMNPEAKTGPYVQICVTDTGTGIPPAIMAKIFDPFFSTKAVGKGTGLGLSTVVGIVKKHGGFLQATSEVGKGSQFLIHLPAASGEAEPSAAIQAPPPAGQGQWVLIADDESAIGEIMQATLEQNNYQVMRANNGAEAVSLLAQNREKIQAVVLDFMMPVMDGAAALLVIRHISPQVPVVLTPGSPDEHAVLANTLRAPRTSALNKPFTATELLHQVNQALNSFE